MDPDNLLERSNRNIEMPMDHLALVLHDAQDNQLWASSLTVYNPLPGCKHAISVFGTLH